MKRKVLRKVLIIGSDARAHALGWNIASKDVQVLFSPGNPGTELEKNCKNLILNGTIKEKFELIVDYAKGEGIDYIVVSSDETIADGIADVAHERHFKRIFAPTQKAAELETDKFFSYDVMEELGIPQARSIKCYNEQEAIKAIHEITTEDGVVIKARGLTKGRGVSVCDSKEEALEERVGHCQKYGPEVLIAERLRGEEFSIFAMSDGKNVIPFEIAFQDFKRAHDGDKGPNCYSSDTEILTNHGWKTFDYLNRDDEVMTFNIKNNFLHFEKPSQIYWMKYRGKMLHFKHRELDLLITPNHKMFVKDRKTEKKSIIEAQNLFGEKLIPISGYWGGKSLRFFILEEFDYKFNRKLKSHKIKFSDWVKFMGLFLSEGCISNKKNERRVYICQISSSIYLDKFKEILSKLPFKFSYDPKNSRFRINSIQLVKVLTEFGISSHKFVPDYIKNANKKQIKEFLDAFVMGDGSIHNGRQRFHSGSKRLIDDIQEMVMKFGKSSIITVDRRMIMLSPLNKKYYRANPIYSLEIKPEKEVGIRKKDIKKVDYNGYVGCVTVSTGFVVVRRNGRISICGNTGGMGSYGPVPFVDKEMIYKINNNMISKVVQKMRENGNPFIGFLYYGMMMTKDGPKVIEINVRLGHPEALPLMMMIKKNSLDEAIRSALDGKIDGSSLKYRKGGAFCTMLASKGYPEEGKYGLVISGLDDVKKRNVKVFYDKTRRNGKEILTDGGRVLGVTARSRRGVVPARELSSSYSKKLNIPEGFDYRTDMGDRVLNI
ncbi:MAG TPA: phosphoribosylglycinamide synthetase C domain-containing protein [Candidatus Nanoarchaeia archaeon]|nr:phosphoribosylglycinamide synthetase C domain-containing protein [Candidatus Nanoarchaeia archaeon]